MWRAPKYEDGKFYDKKNLSLWQRRVKYILIYAKSLHCVIGKMKKSQKMDDYE
jgi:hypothetical protein